MNTLRYSTADLQTWAEFSGDFNPIHFEPARAAQLNLSAVPAHGMRVMLDVKRLLLQEAIAHDCSGPTLMFKAVLRAPVLKDAMYNLVIQSRRNGLDFAVTNEGASMHCMTGYLRPIPECNESRYAISASCLDVPAWHSFSIGTEEWNSALQLLPYACHGAGSAWLLLDALLFSALLRQPRLFAQVSKIAGFTSARSVEDLMQHATVLQTHHSNVISAELQRAATDPDRNQFAFDDIRCDIETPVITGDGPGGYVVQATLNACTGAKFLLRTTVALMISPLTSSAQQPEY